MPVASVNTTNPKSKSQAFAFIKAMGLIMSLISVLFAVGQPQAKQRILSSADFKFLEQLTKDVLDSARIHPGQVISTDFGPNNTGGVLVRPGGRSSYPSYWIRDYAMSLETGFVSAAEQKHMLLLTASTQCDQTWITSHGSMVPMGAIADHIRIDDGMPIYFPGTYSYHEQGDKIFGVFPPYCDQFYFVRMAHEYVHSTGDLSILDSAINGFKLVDRLEMAFKMPPTRNGKHLVYTTDELRGVDYGFRDVIMFTGDLLMPSLLKYKAALELAVIFEKKGAQEKVLLYKRIADQIKKEIPSAFADGRGMLLASTGKSKQADVWSTLLAVYYEILEGDEMIKTCTILKEAYLKGDLAKNGNIRHVLIADDYNETTSWEKSLARKNTYQNGAYWGTPLGWACDAIARVDLKAAKQLAKEYIDDLRKEDFRKGNGFGAPWECYNDDKPQNSVYLTTVASPYIVFKNQ
ncbi:MAG: hypothetical protein ACK5AO_02980 [bacterium]